MIFNVVGIGSVNLIIDFEIRWYYVLRHKLIDVVLILYEFFKMLLVEEDQSKIVLNEE